MKNKVLFCQTVAALLSISCTNSSHLLVYQHSNVGLNTGINPANQSIHARIGVRSEVAAIVPKYEIKGANKTEEGKYEAASAYFGTRFRVNSIWEVPEAAEVLTTGNAAVLTASRGRLSLKDRHDEAASNQPSADTTPSSPSTGGIQTPIHH